MTEETTHHRKLVDRTPQIAQAIAEHREYRGWYIAISADEFRAVRDDPDGQRAALLRFWKRGYTHGYIAHELYDFLALNEVSILDEAGYEEPEIEAVLEISDRLSEDEIMAAALPEEQAG